MKKRAPVRPHPTASGLIRTAVRRVLLASVGLAVPLAASTSVLAADILRGNRIASPVAQVSAAQSQAAQQAREASRRAHDALSRATQTLKAVRAAQDAARNLALTVPSSVANGLRPGGLVVASGAEPGTELWRGAEAPTETQNGARTQVTIEQTEKKAILTWDSFNVGRETDVYFDQRAGGEQAGSWIALNRVNDPTAAPSQILGSIKAEGQVYVVNRNGVVFGGASQVNVRSLAVSSLDISNATFLGDVVTPRWEGTATFAAPAGVTPGNVTVEAGATINAAKGGQVLLLGGNVENAGTIRTPGGQTLLAAGDAVYLKASTEAGLRGYEAEVDGEGIAINRGDVLAERGNVTMVAKDVRVEGRLGATTTVAANGSVTLHARHNTVLVPLDENQPNSPLQRKAQDTGTLTIAPGALIDVLPDLRDQDTVASRALLNPSSVELYGRTVHLDRDSTVWAPGGKVVASAVERPMEELAPNVADASRVYVDAGALIDTSGTRDVLLEMARNFIKVELRGNELRDTPLLRNSFLHGQTVWIDARRTGTFDDPFMSDVEWFQGEQGVWYGSALFDASAYISLIRRGIGELTAKGGTINLQALGDVIVRDGAILDVSGGSLQYSSGYGRVTQLQAGAHRFDIADADRNALYDGIAGGHSRNHSRWGVNESWSSSLGSGLRYEQGYAEGQAAGTVSISAPQAVLDGHVYAETSMSDRQRELGGQLTGGALVLGDGGAKSARDRLVDYQLRAARLQNGLAGLATDFDVTTSLAQDFVSSLSADRLAEGGLGTLAIYANDRIEVSEGTRLTMEDRSEVALTGSNVSVDGVIRAHGGSIDIRTAYSRSTLDAADRQTIRVGSSAELDVSGRWVNDFNHPAGTGADALAKNGGVVNIRTAEISDSLTARLFGFEVGSVSLAQGSVIDVSGGAHVDFNGELSLGRAGGISIGATDVRLDSELRGYALATGRESAPGGTLSVAARAIQIGGELPVRDPAAGRTDTLLGLQADFFTRGGFSTYALNGYETLTISDGTQITPLTASRVVTGDPRGIAQGTPLAEIGGVALQSADRRQAASLSLDSSASYYVADQNDALSKVDARGLLSLERGASIILDPGATVSLTAAGRLVVAGTIDAPGGDIRVGISAAAGTEEGVRIGDIPLPGEAAPIKQDRSVWLTSDAQLLARGTLVRTPSELGLRSGHVLDGGTVTIDSSANGYVVTEAGSLIDVSGAVAVLDLPAVTLSLGDALSSSRPLTQATDVWSDAGSIAIMARDGGYLEGGYRADPAHEAAGGGSLSIGAGYPVNGPAIFALSTDLAVRASGSRLPENLRHGDELGVGTTPLGILHLAADTMATAGFDSVRLSADRAINFEGDVSLATRRSLQIDAVNVRVTATPEAMNPTVRLDSHYLSIGRSTSLHPDLQPEGGTGSLEANGALIDLLGDLTLFGFNTAAIRSSGDLRLVGVLNSNAPLLDENGQQVLDPSSGLAMKTTLPTGSLRMAGALEMHAAQIYPTLRTRYSIVATGPEGSVVFDRPQAAAAAALPYSAGGSLTVNAQTIVQGGTLRSPFGKITLDAGETGTVTLTEGSITSVSGRGLLVPYGLVENGDVWSYGYGLNEQGQPNVSRIVLPPAKRLTLQGETVDFAAGAEIDVSGGGELLGTEFVPGTGGSRDILTSHDGAPVYAVLPSYAGAAAPVDPDAGGNTSLGIGDSVYLSGVPGLTDGYYLLLPGRYALLPGAFRVTVEATQTDVKLGARALADGSYLVGGYRASGAGAQRDARNSTFRVMAGDVVRDYAQYVEHKASKFFATGAARAEAATPRLPIDAGQMVLSASGTLRLDGSANFAAAEGGRAGLADIVADSIAVVKAGDPAVAGYGLTIDGAALSRLGAGSLLLGGTRASTAEGMIVDARSSRLLIANDESSALVGPEVILVAANRSGTADAGEIAVASGAVIRAEGEVEGDVTSRIRIGTDAKPARPGDPIPSPTGGGNGAALILSNASNVDLTRADLRADTTGRLPGALNVAGGATLSAAGALVLDSTADTSVAPEAVLDAPSLEVAAGRIGFGTAPAGTDGLLLNDAALTRLGDAQRLLLRSYSTIDLHGAVAVGNVNGAGQPLLGELVLDGALVHRGSGDATLRAQHITLRNTGGRLDAAADTPAADGVLTVSARSIAVDRGENAIRGFGEVAFAAETKFTLGGAGALTIGTAASASSVTVTAGRVTGIQGATQRLTALGDLTVRSNGANNIVAEDGFGAALALEGRNVLIAGSIDLPSGTLALNAVENLTLDVGARVNTSGRNVTFFDQTRTVPAGNVSLTAQRGSVNLLAGSLIDLSAGGNADAGRLQVQTPNGALNLLGEVRGGSFALDASTIPDFAALNAQLNSGGLSDGRSFRVRTGDVVLDGSTRTQALDVNVDTGSLRVASTAMIDADGAKGGTVRLVAAGDLTVEGGAVIQARGSAGRGGRVDLVSGGGDLAVRAGSRIDVSGDDRGGKVHLRAARQSATSGFRLVDAAGSFVGAERVDAEAVWGYSGVTNVDAALLGATVADATAFMDAEEDSIIAALGRSADEMFHLVAGIELRSDGDMSVVEDLNLAGVRPGGEAGVLTLRAGGTLNIERSISDAFDTVEITGTFGGTQFVDVLRDDDSWSYRLVGGADVASADPLSLKPLSDLTAGSGNLVLGTDVIVRTGTGSIDLAAGRSIVFEPGNVLYLRHPTDPTQIIAIDRAVDSQGNPLPGFEDWLAVGDPSDPTLYRPPAVVYTAGRLAGPGRVRFASGGENWAADDPTTSFSEWYYAPWVTFADGGGDLRLTAQEDVQGGGDARRAANWRCNSSSGTDGACFRAPGIPEDIVAATAAPPHGQQFVIDWLARQGELTRDGNNFSLSDPYASGYALNPGQVLNTAWGILFGAFQQGMGTLGGGDVTITTGGNLDNATIAVAHSGWLAAGDGSTLERATSPADATLLTYGGGDLTVRSGGDASGNLFYVGQGQGDLRVGGSMTGVDFDNVFALADGSFDVTARGDVSIGTVFNPTLLGALTPIQEHYQTSDGVYFSTYTADSALQVRSIGGDVRLSTMHHSDLARLSVSLSEPLDPDDFFSGTRRRLVDTADRILWGGALQFYPSNLDAVAFGGDVSTGKTDRFGNVLGDPRLGISAITMLPAANGNLSLLAADSIDLRAGGIVVSDADPSLIPGILNPGFDFERHLLFPLVETLQPEAGRPGSDRTLSHAASLYRAQDSDPVRLYARDGSIQFGPTVFSPKPTTIQAGLDIVDLNFAGQNFSPAQVTTIRAGRDIGRPALLAENGFPLDRNGGGGRGATVLLGGPGTLELIAGRHLDLMESQGIETVGNEINPHLPRGQGANVAAIVGAGTNGPDYAAFAAAYIDPAAPAGSVRNYAEDMAKFMREYRDDESLSEQQAWDLFMQLPVSARDASIREVFYRELAMTGKEAATPDGLKYKNYNAGYDAVDVLFPNGDDYVGNLTMRYSQIKTTQGGDIDLLVPGGRIDAGQTVRPRVSNTQPKTPDRLGITTVRGGDISVFLDETMTVNSSRVFTLGGGGILVWSSNGDIDAGKGAKTALLAPPPRLIFDPATGTFTTELTGEATGSGIGTLITSPDQERGDVILIAPRGRVDAGEAGIRVSGSLIIAAQQIVGADNIQVSGSVLGLPDANRGQLSVDRSDHSAEQAVAEAMQEAREQSSRRDDLPSIITVEVLGYGGGSANEDEQAEKN